jgi:hypothetical protein
VAQPLASSPLKIDFASARMISFDQFTSERICFYGGAPHFHFQRAGGVTFPASGGWPLAAGLDSVGGDFDFGDAAEGEEKFYQIHRRLFRRLFHDVADGVGDRGVEQNATGLEARHVHAHGLAWFEHASGWFSYFYRAALEAEMQGGAGFGAGSRTSEGQSMRGSTCWEAASLRQDRGPPSNLRWGRRKG